MGDREKIEHKNSRQKKLVEVKKWLIKKSGKKNLLDEKIYGE